MTYDVNDTNNDDFARLDAELSTVDEQAFINNVVIVIQPDAPAIDRSTTSTPQIIPEGVETPPSTPNRPDRPALEDPRNTPQRTPFLLSANAAPFVSQRESRRHRRHRQELRR